MFEILKSCLSLVNLSPDIDSFEKVKSDVSLSYITNGDDNLLTVFDYLMRRLYYFESRDDSLKFLVYNEQSTMY